jgi:hypothetical protein
VVSKLVVGSGTPDGPAASASILPTRSGIPVVESPHSAKETTNPLILSCHELPENKAGSYQGDVVSHDEIMNL